VKINLFTNEVVGHCHFASNHREIRRQQPTEFIPIKISTAVIVAPKLAHLLNDTDEKSQCPTGTLRSWWPPIAAPDAVLECASVCREGSSEHSLRFRNYGCAARAGHGQPLGKAGKIIGLQVVPLAPSMIVQDDPGRIGLRHRETSRP